MPSRLGHVSDDGESSSHSGSRPSGGCAVERGAVNCMPNGNRMERVRIMRCPGLLSTSLVDIVFASSDPGRSRSNCAQCGELGCLLLVRVSLRLAGR